MKVENDTLKLQLTDIERTFSERLCVLDIKLAQTMEDKRNLELLFVECTNSLNHIMDSEREQSFELRNMRKRLLNSQIAFKFFYKHKNVLETSS